jgi:ABC-type hemin transport system substrate-binding protein
MSIETERLEAILHEVDSVSRQLGDWDGHMLMCYVASSAAWKAKMVVPGDTKQRIALGKRLGDLFKEAKEILEKIGV